MEEQNPGLGGRASSSQVTMKRRRKDRHIVKNKVCEICGLCLSRTRYYSHAKTHLAISNRDVINNDNDVEMTFEHQDNIDDNQGEIGEARISSSEEGSDLGGDLTADTDHWTDDDSDGDDDDDAEGDTKHPTTTVEQVRHS